MSLGFCEREDGCESTEGWRGSEKGAGREVERAGLVGNPCVDER